MVDCLHITVFGPSLGWASVLSIWQHGLDGQEHPCQPPQPKSKSGTKLDRSAGEDTDSPAIWQSCSCWSCILRQPCPWAPHWWPHAAQAPQITSWRAARPPGIIEHGKGEPHASSMRATSAKAQHSNRCPGIAQEEMRGELAFFRLGLT